MTVTVASVLRLLRLLPDNWMKKPELRLLPDHWMKKPELLRWAAEVGAELPPRATKARIYSEIVFTVAHSTRVVNDEEGHPKMVLYSQPPLPAWATPPWMRAR